MALLLIIAFWIFTFSVLSVRSSLTETLPFTMLVPRRIAMAVGGGVLCFGMVLVFERLGERSFARRVAWGLAGALVMAVLLVIFRIAINRFVIPVPGIAPITFDGTAMFFVVWFAYFLAWVGAHLALTYHWDTQDQERRVAAMTEQAQKAQIAALRYQINPHFLFNALNSISALVLERRNEEADAMLTNLSTFFRSTLAADSSGTIGLGDEIRLQRFYLDIEKVRFAERMQVEVDVPEALHAARVPALILQPLVENAVLHGVGRTEAVTQIRIAAARDGDRLRLCVTDDGTGSAAATSGTRLGLTNVADRLRAHFGMSAHMVAGRHDGGGFRVELTLPLELAT